MTPFTIIHKNGTELKEYIADLCVPGIWRSVAPWTSPSCVDCVTYLILESGRPGFAYSKPLVGYSIIELDPAVWEVSRHLNPPSPERVVSDIMQATTPTPRMNIPPGDPAWEGIADNIAKGLRESIDSAFPGAVDWNALPTPKEPNE